MSASTMNGHGRVPVRTILASIGLIVLAALALVLVYELRQVLVWIVVAAFFTVALYPVTGWVERRIGGHRVLATFVVFLLVVVVVAGLLTLFIVPVAREGAAFADQAPQLVRDARAGRGPIGGLLERTGALTWVQDNSSRIGAYATGLTTPAAGVLRGIATGIAGCCARR